VPISGAPNAVAHLEPGLYIRVVSQGGRSNIAGPADTRARARREARDRRSYKPTQTYKPIWPYTKIVMDKFNRVFPGEFKNRLDRAISKAR